MQLKHKLRVLVCLFRVVCFLRIHLIIYVKRAQYYAYNPVHGRPLSWAQQLASRLALLEMSRLQKLEPLVLKPKVRSLLLMLQFSICCFDDSATNSVVMIIANEPHFFFAADVELWSCTELRCIFSLIHCARAHIAKHIHRIRPAITNCAHTSGFLCCTFTNNHLSKHVQFSAAPRLMLP